MIYRLIYTVKKSPLDKMPSVERHVDFISANNMTASHFVKKLKELHPDWEPVQLDLIEFKNVITY